MNNNKIKSASSKEYTEEMQVAGELMEDDGQVIEPSSMMNSLKHRSRLYFKLFTDNVRNPDLVKIMRDLINSIFLKD